MYVSHSIPNVILSLNCFLTVAKVQINSPDQLIVSLTFLRCQLQSFHFDLQSVKS